ncbi:MAG: hypothetical protein KAS04_03645 [Candidatus Aenigmarchaeota archaeon]|nr:hypothetical protein [Candidatus Aenigmarchaeota archaeon]
MDIELLTGNTIVGFKDEVVPGTFIEITAPDYNVVVHEPGKADVDYHTKKLGKPAIGSLITSQSKSGMRSVQFPGKVELKFSGDEEVAPVDSKIIASAGLVVAAPGGAPVTYTYSGLAPCATLSGIVTDLGCGSAPNAIDYKVAGIQSNLVIAGTGVLEEITLDYTFSGVDYDRVDNLTPIKVATGIDTGATEKLMGGGFTMGAQPYTLNSFSLDLGNTVSMVKDPSSVDANGEYNGIKKFKITATDCKLAINVKKIDIGTSGIPTKIIQDTILTDLKIDMVHWDIEITECSIITAKDVDGDGIIMQDLEIEVKAFVMTQKN